MHRQQRKRDECSEARACGKDHTNIEQKMRSTLDMNNPQETARTAPSIPSFENKHSRCEMPYGGLERDRQTFPTSVDRTESVQTKDNNDKMKTSTQESERSLDQPTANKPNDGDSKSHSGMLNFFSRLCDIVLQGGRQSTKESVKVKVSRVEKSSSEENMQRKVNNTDQWVALPSEFSNTYSSTNYWYDHPDDEENTLANALERFGLFPRLQDLEKSIEEVRIGKRTKEEHEQLLKQIDKEMQKLSLKYHPDKVKARGGTEEEVIKAQKVQTTLNATRTVLNVLSKTFLDDITTDHKYEFYKNLHMRSLGNENDINDRIYEVLFKISMISEIKQVYIISEIRKFLTESKCCLKEYLNENVSNFKKHRDLALFQLKCCIEGYEKLHLELEEVDKECKQEKLDNIRSVIVGMIRECKREHSLLKELRKTARLRIYKFFSPGNESINPYFVLPFVSYVNVIRMCDVMINNNVSWWMRQIQCDQQVSDHGDGELSHLMHLYYLTSYYIGNHNKEKAIEIMKECNSNLPDDERCSGILYENCQKYFFKKILIHVIKYMDDMFKVDNYVESSSRNILKKQLEECLKMMAEFKEIKQELSKDIDKLKAKTVAVEEKCDKLCQESEEFNRHVAESIEKSKQSMERASIVMAEKCDKLFQVSEELDRNAAKKSNKSMERASIAMEENLEKYDKLFQVPEDFDRNVTKTLERNKQCMERASLFLSDGL